MSNHTSGRAHGRAEALAAAYEAAQLRFIEIVESVADDQWRRVGANYPARVNDEDELRTVGVIAHHVALDEPWHLERIQRIIAGDPVEPVDMAAMNRDQAREHADASRGEVLQMLRAELPTIAAAIRAIDDDALDLSRETPVGPMSVAERIERVLIGHITAHQGSIEAVLRG